MTTGALTGVRVVELAEVWAGPFGCTLLGDLGADVVKVESYPRNPMTRPLGENDWRVSRGDGPPYERAWAQHVANRNKRNVALNVRTEAGVEALRRLLATADVVVDTFSAGTMERLGFGWDALHRLNPQLIAISLSGWGAAGDYRSYVGLGSGFDCATGHAWARGYPWHPPQDSPSITHSDATVPLALVFAVATALQRRKRNGEGCFVDLSQVEQLATQLPGLYAEWSLNERLPERVGNGDEQLVPHGCFRAQGEDAWVVIAAENDEQWEGIARAAGRPEWAGDGHPWASVVGRLREREAVEAAVADYAASGSATEIADAVQANGAIAEPVAGPQELLLSPQLTERSWFQTIDHPYTGSRIQTGFLWSVSPDPPQWDRLCALVGEHNVEVLSEHGYDEAEIAGLAADGVIGTSYGDFPPREEPPVP